MRHTLGAREEGFGNRIPARRDPAEDQAGDHLEDDGDSEDADEGAERQQPAGSAWCERCDHGDESVNPGHGWGELPQPICFCDECISRLTLNP